MRVYYRGPTVLVTDQGITVTDPFQHRVRIEKLDHLYAVRANLHIPRSYLLRRLWPISIAMAISILAVAFNPVSGRTGPFVASAVALAICGMSLLAIPGRTQPVNELWAVVDGRHVCLFRSADRQTFGQVQRAVARARDQHQ